MKTKLTSVTYLGYTAMDRRFSTAMLPWLLRELSSNTIQDKLSVSIEDGYLKAYNGNFEPVIVHRLVDIIRASQVPGRPEELFYILFNEKEGLLNCFLFRAATALEVADLFTQMREPSPGTASPKGSASSLTNGSVTRNIGFSNQSGTEHMPWTSPAISLPGNCNSNLASEPQSLVRSTSNASALTSLSADLSPSESHFFEVLYIGKVRISQRKVPETLIDDALQKFAQHEAEKALRRRHSLVSSTGTSLYSNDSKENLADDKNNEVFDNIKNATETPSTTPLEPDKAAWKSAETITPKTKTKELEDEFDMFTKERVEKKTTAIKRPTSIPLEPSILVLNVPKGPKNLGTVSEDEEKDVRAVISETANSINKFCEDKKNEDRTKNGSKAVSFKEPFSETNTFSPVKDSKEIIRKIVNESSEIKISKDSIVNKTLEENKKEISFEEIRLKANGDNIRKMPENKPFLRDRSASIGTISLKTPIAQLIGEQNRTMLFQVGRAELRLISPDRKQILLHREFKDVASCVLGYRNKDHFGFVCRETNDTYACYVFKCESDSVATEVVNAIKQAFVFHADFIKKTREKSPNMTCEHCPMLWYHRLCHDIEGLNEKKTHAFILRRIEQLPDDEQDIIITKYQGGTNHIYETAEHNAFLMMLLRAHCEGKQQRHVHDTAENRSEFLNQFLGGGAILVKKLAKRSFSSGFDHLLKRRASRDEILPHDHKKEESPLPTPATPENEATPSELVAPDVRSKSLSPAVISLENESLSSPKHMTPTLEEEGENEEDEIPVNSPMMDIFLKVSDNRPAPSDAGTEPDATWRQAIYQTVLQPTEVQEELSANLLRMPSARKGKRNKEELRQLWKMAIDQTILLVRMEKENARLRENEESSAVRRIKLEYTELGGSDAGTSLMWDSLLSRDPSQHTAKVDRHMLTQAVIQGEWDPSQHTAKVDRHMLTQAVIQGVPRVSRGAVWYFLAEQASLRAPPPVTSLYPHYHTPYRTLLSSLSKHHHAILIDLGRTFPKHGYFASALGPGQLALYNLLKAYSLLDPDVGYCQGLSFVAGVLLLHMEEAEAYILLRHLMFRRGLRKQYLPDMLALQVQLYQLSRLLRDHEPELHAKLESLDISPALYAAPWMLTLFTSQFPLGFVVRVFDLIFLDSLDVIFSISLAILSSHRDGLMMCESCEEAAEYLKHKLPDMTPQTYHKIMKKVHTLDISRQLSDYAVEYSVLREEMPRVATLAALNRQLSADTSRMTDELDSAMDAITNYQKNQTRLESINKSMEQQLTMLSRFIANNKLDTPIEVKKIVQNHSKRLSFSSKLFSTKFATTDEEKMHKTGVSTPNLFAKINKDEFMKKETESPEKERKHFIMKKSLSVQSGLIAPNIRPLMTLEEKAELQENLEMGKKGFFANTHEQIRQERLFEKQLKHDFDENLKKLDTKISPKSYMDDLNIFQSRKSVSLNITSDKLDSGLNITSNKLNSGLNITSDKLSGLNITSNKLDSGLNITSDKLDSGFVSPLTPEQRMDSCSTISHPLSDVDVDIKFDGQSTKLKQIRSTKCTDIKT